MAHGRTKSEYATIQAVPIRICAVSFADVRGIRHTVEVQAESLFEAAILGVRTFKGDPWIEPGSDVATAGQTIPASPRERAPVLPRAGYPGGYPGFPGGYGRPGAYPGAYPGGYPGGG